MRKFNRAFNINTTKVKIEGIIGWHKVVNIHETRQWINIENYTGAFQRDHIEKFTNK